jgi:hypothetical protein
MLPVIGLSEGAGIRREYSVAGLDFRIHFSCSNQAFWLGDDSKIIFF